MNRKQGTDLAKYPSWSMGFQHRCIFFNKVPSLMHMLVHYSPTMQVSGSRTRIMCNISIYSIVLDSNSAIDRARQPMNVQASLHSSNLVRDVYWVTSNHGSSCPGQVPLIVPVFSSFLDGIDKVNGVRSMRHGAPESWFMNTRWTQPEMEAKAEVGGGPGRNRCQHC